jgi:hypothetical protein
MFVIPYENGKMTPAVCESEVFVYDYVITER